jgi:anti-sigma factor RsiW
MIEHPTRACPHFLERFSDFVDGSLPTERRSSLQAHLDCCEGCLRHLAAYRNGVEALNTAPVIEVDPSEFWEQVQRRIWLEGIEAPRRRFDRRMTAYAALAMSAIVLVAWLGVRIDFGLQQIAESARRPVVVIAGPPIPTTTSVNDTPMATGSVSRERASDRHEVAQPSRSRRSSTAIAQAAVTPDLDAAAQAMFEREVASLREQLDTDAWLGASLGLDPDVGSVPGVRFQTVDVIPSEPNPVNAYIQYSFTRP